jgi:hypothetical protein
MGDQPPRSPIFPAKCARCGGRLTGPVSFCPHCGAPARLAFGDRVPSQKPEVATGSATARAEGARADVPLGELLWPSPPTPLFNTADSDPYGDVRLSSHGGARHWAVKAGTALTALAFVVLYGAAVLLHRHDDKSTREQQAASRTAQGRVTTIGASPSNQAPRTAQGPTITAAAPHATVASSAAAPVTTLHSETSTQPVEPVTTGPQHGPVASVAPPLPGPPPAVVPRPSQPSSSRSQNEKTSSTNSTMSDKRFSDKNRRLMSLALARAHSGLEKNDLRMARSGVYWALSLQPNNSEAIKLEEDLLLRERARLRH